jgi:hypothetical protein
MIHTCETCSRQYTNKRMLKHHIFRKHQNSGKPTNRRIELLCCCIYSKKEMYVSELKDHIDSLSSCICCGKKTSTSFNKYCSSSCAATVNNKFRTPRNSVGIETSSSLKDNYSTRTVYPSIAVQSMR